MFCGRIGWVWADMSDYFLITPDDVGAVDAQRVLDTLNGLTTAEAIDQAIDIPGKSDVGIELAKRIVAKRDALGGFTSLAQLLEVPLIGPERFSSIVQAIVGAVSPLSESSQLSALRDALNALRDRVFALEAKTRAASRVTLRIIKDAEFLGQPAVIEATVTDHNQRPKIGAPVTFFATWGIVQTNEGLRSRCGKAVTAMTGARGTARVTLLTPLAEQLGSTQQAALESMLSTLKPDTATPKETEAALVDLAKQYRWDIKSAFRSAVDLYFEALEESPKHHLNAHDYMADWSYIESTLFAHVMTAADSEAEAGTAVEAAGALDHRLKNWMGPWLKSYIALVNAESTLPGDLQAAKQKSEDKHALIDSVSNSLLTFVDRERGVVGKRICQSVAKSSVSNFLNNELDGLATSDAADVLSNLGAISSTISNVGAGVVNVIKASKTGLRKELDTRVGIAVGDAQTSLNTRIDTEKASILESVNRSIDATTSALTSKYTTLESQMADKLDISAVGSVTLLTEKLAAIETISSTITTFEDRISTVEGKIKI